MGIGSTPPIGHPDPLMLAVYIYDCLRVLDIVHSSASVYCLDLIQDFMGHMGEECFFFLLVMEIRIWNIVDLLVVAVVSDLFKCSFSCVFVRDTASS